MSDTATSTAVDTVVIGGGVAGLLAALNAARGGRTTVLLEAEPAVGGCVRSHRVAGLTLDRGAESFATARPAVGALAAELGLSVEAPTGHPAWLYHRGGPAPIPAATLFGIPAHPTAADVRRVIGTVGALRAQLDRILPVREAPASGDRVARLGELVERRLGRRVLRRLVAPVVAGVYSADPAGLDAAAVAPGLLPALRETGSLAAAVARLRGDGPPSGAAVATVTGGMARLTEALLAALIAAGGSVRTSAPALGVVRRHGGWTVTIGPPGSVGSDGAAHGTPSQPVGAIAAGNVVVAVPGAVAAPLVAQATDGTVLLPTAPATAVAIVTLVVDEPSLDAAPRGTGVLVAPDVTAVTAKALTHATAKWEYIARAARAEGEHRHVLRLSYGRGGAAAPVIPPADAFIEAALRDASTLVGTRLDAHNLVGHAIVRYSNQLAPRLADQRAALERVPLQLKDFPGLTVRGSAITGTGLGAVVADATHAAGADESPTRAGSNHDHY